MKKIYLFTALALGLLAAGCSKENPFEADSANSKGKVLKSAIALDVKVDVTQREKMTTRADVNPDDFNIVFTRTDQSTPTVSYKYAEMPDVVELPVGSYVCTATLGEDRVEEWENPYFLGRSDAFEVSAYEITSSIGEIECRLENIKVTVEFDPYLVEHITGDSYVLVKVGDSDGLQFGLAEASAKRAGFYRQNGETTLVAEFHGTVDGKATVETKSLTGVTKGNHYNVVFKLHSHSTGGSGDAEGEVVVDATVTVTDIEHNVEVGDEEILDDNERPNEGKDDDPNPPTPPRILPVR